MYIMVDVESDGPIPGDYSMISFGAVACDVVNFPKGKENHNTFYAELKPISEKWIPEALAVSGFTRNDTLGFNDPKNEMLAFKDWIHNVSGNSRPMFISDNNGFDWQFINWYFHHFVGENPFGFSSTNLGSLYKGMAGNVRKNFKHLRKTKHTHHPVDDSLGNVEAFYHMIKQMNLRGVR